MIKSLAYYFVQHPEKTESVIRQATDLWRKSPMFKMGRVLPADWLHNIQPESERDKHPEFESRLLTAPELSEVISSAGSEKTRRSSR